MIEAENPLVKVGLIGAAAWSSAVQSIRGTIPTGDEMMRLQWEAAGIVTPDGELDPEWARTISVTQGSLRGAEVVSVYEHMVFAATVLVGDGTVVCVTARGATEEVDGAEKITAVHPMLEVAMAPSAQAWLLLRRVLPPLDALRAEPRPTAPGEVELLTLDGVEIPETMKASQETFSTHFVNLPTLPTAVVDAVEDPVATVFAYMLGVDGGKVRQSSQAWSLGSRGLYRVDSDTAAVGKVPHGDLAHRILAEL